MRRFIPGFATLLIVAAPMLAHAQCPDGNCGNTSGGYVESGSGCDNGNCDGDAGGRRSLIASMRARCQSGECVERSYGAPDLFYNFWVSPSCQGGQCGNNPSFPGAAPDPGSVGAELYVAPIPVPAYVGHTFYTYQPFMPHEMLYPHKRTYYRYYDEGRGFNRTAVSWSRSPMYVARTWAGFLSLPR